MPSPRALLRTRWRAVPNTPPDRRQSTSQAPGEAADLKIDLASLQKELSALEGHVAQLEGEIERAPCPASGLRDALRVLRLRGLQGLALLLLICLPLDLRASLVVACALAAWAFWQEAATTDKRGSRVEHAPPESLHPIRKDLKRLRAALNSGLSIQREASDARAQHHQRIFPPDKVFSEAGLRLNAFANIPRVDFKPDVYAKLDGLAQRAFDDFSSRFDQSMRASMHLIDTKRFFQLPDDFTKLRFLQADAKRDSHGNYVAYDVEKSIERLVSTVVWRQTSGLDDFISKPNQVLLRRYRALRIRVIVGLDKQDRPFMVERVGEFFSSTVVKDALSIEQYVLCYAYELCELLAAMRDSVQLTGQYAHRCAYLADMKGIRFLEAYRLLPLLKVLIKSVDVHFPELAGPLYLINAPPVLYRSWTIVKGFLDPNTVAKIHLDPTDGQSSLGELFGWDVIPTEFGGRNNEAVVGHVPVSIDGEWAKQYPLPA